MSALSTLDSHNSHCRHNGTAQHAWSHDEKTDRSVFHRLREQTKLFAL